MYFVIYFHYFHFIEPVFLIGVALVEQSSQIWGAAGVGGQGERIRFFSDDLRIVMFYIRCVCESTTLPRMQGAAAMRTPCVVCLKSVTGGNGRCVPDIGCRGGPKYRCVG